MPEQHEVTIYQHKGYHPETYDPFVIEEGTFLVDCSCGWYSGQRDTYEAAVAAAREHAEKVPTGVVGLFGEPPEDQA